MPNSQLKLWKTWCAFCFQMCSFVPILPSGGDVTLMHSILHLVACWRRRHCMCFMYMSCRVVDACAIAKKFAWHKSYAFDDCYKISSFSDMGFYGRGKALLQTSLGCSCYSSSGALKSYALCRCSSATCARVRPGTFSFKKSILARKRTCHHQISKCSEDVSKIDFFFLFLWWRMKHDTARSNNTWLKSIISILCDEPAWKLFKLLSH